MTQKHHVMHGRDHLATGSDPIPGIDTFATRNGHVIEDEGTPRTQRTNLDFIGSLVAVTDDAANDKTKVTITTPVTSLAKSGATALTGDVTLSAGTNVTLTQSGQDISIAASGGGGGGNDYSARVYHSLDQSIANSTNTTLAFDSERFDTDTIHDTATNNSRLTCKHAGKYLIFAHVYFDPNATGYRFVGIYHSVVTGFIAVEYTVGNGTVGPAVSIATVYNMAVNDYVEVQVKQNSGGALNVRALTAYSTEFGMAKILG